MKTTNIGIEELAAKKLTINLNELLSNFQIHYQNLRGLHWNIKGKSFFELHVKFEEFYIDSQDKIDFIAERILTLGGVPLHTFEDYIKVAKVKVGKEVSNDAQGVKLIIDSLTEILQLERKILEQASNVNDEGTNSMMSDFIAEQEKTIWMLNAWLG